MSPEERRIKLLTTTAVQVYAAHNGDITIQSAMAHAIAIEKLAHDHVYAALTKHLNRVG